jgi:4-alpha-glucanotransferase
VQQASIFQQRRTGVLLHITSLPSGTLGKDAYQFVDFLHQSGVTVWQMLPLGPTHADGSPYQCLSAHAANSKLVCLDTIKQKAWADADELDGLTFSTFMAHAYRLFDQHASEDEKNKFAEFQQQQH